MLNKSRSSYRTVAALVGTMVMSIASVPSASAGQTIALSGGISDVHELGTPECVGTPDAAYPLGCNGVAYIHHVEEHEFTGSLSGTWLEDALIIIDTRTGLGTIAGTGTFTGSVDGHSGTAQVSITGQGTNIIMFTGNWYAANGTGGLAGLAINGNWQLNIGSGGTYTGTAYLP